MATSQQDYQKFISDKGLTDCESSFREFATTHCPGCGDKLSAADNGVCSGCNTDNRNWETQWASIQ